MLKLTWLALTIILIGFPSFLFSQTNLERLYDYDTKKWGIRNEFYQVVVPPIYDEIEPRLDTVFAGKIDGKMLLFNGDGTVRVPPIYQHIQSNFNNFRNQYGFAAVTRNGKTPDSWGMIDSRGKVILPEKFKYVRAITPDLFVAKVDIDSMLQFFNGKGELLYKIAGRYVSSLDIDNTCFNVEKWRGKNGYYRTDGSPVPNLLPEGTAMWTNGQLTWVRLPSDGPYLGSGMVDEQGKAVIPFEYSKFRHGLPGHFIAYADHSDYTQRQSTVFDHVGKIVIPKGKYQILPFGEVYMLIDVATDKAGIYSASGQEIVPIQYRYSMLHISESDHGKNVPESFPKRYAQLHDMQDTSTFLVRDDGKVLRPAGAKTVRYLAENQPIIIELTPDSGKVFPRYMAIDFEGKTVLPPDFSSLNWTGNPRLLLGAKYSDTPSLYGFIDPADPGKTVYEINSMPSRMGSGYYRAEYSGRIKKILKPDMSVLVEGQFNWLSEPDLNQFKQFYAEHPTQGPLVAVGFRQGMEYGQWLAFNAEGKEFFMKKNN